MRSGPWSVALYLVMMIGTGLVGGRGVKYLLDGHLYHGIGALIVAGVFLFVAASVHRQIRDDGVGGA